jgi:uncharacterized membrane protein YidH (DUF202 family)
VHLRPLQTEIVLCSGIWRPYEIRRAKPGIYLEGRLYPKHIRFVSSFLIAAALSFSLFFLARQRHLLAWFRLGSGFISFHRGSTLRKIPATIRLPRKRRAPSRKRKSAMRNAAGYLLLLVQLASAHLPFCCFVENSVASCSCSYSCCESFSVVVDLPETESECSIPD